MKREDAVSGAPATASLPASALSPKSLALWRAYWIYAAAIFALTAVLAFSGLGNAWLWSDETITAIPARNFLTTGRFSGWDGRNLFAYRGGGLLDENLNSLNTPLEVVTAAVSFKLFGVSTWAARALFVIAGLAALALFILLLRDEFRNCPAAAWYALPAFAFSHIFLLNIRQCHYYALALFFALATYMSWRRAIARKRTVDFALMALAAAGLFYSNCLLAAAFLASLAALHFLLHRHALRRADIPPVVVGAAIFCAAVIPFAVIFRVWHRPELLQVSLPWYVNQSILVWRYLRDLNTIACVPWMMAAFLLVWIIARWHRDPLARQAAVWALFGFTCILFLALLSPQPADQTMMADTRLYIPAVPFLLGAVGAGLALIHHSAGWGRLLAVPLLVITLCANVFCLPLRSAEPRWLLPALIQEVTHPYPTATQAVAEFLLANAAQDDVVWAWQDQHNYPLMFYIGHKLRFTAMIERQTPLAARARALGVPLLGERLPDWVILFGMDDSSVEPILNLGLPIPVGGKPAAPRYRFVKILNVYCNETQRPEFYNHHFAPIRDFDPRCDAVYVFRRMQSAG